MQENMSIDEAIGHLDGLARRIVSIEPELRPAYTPKFRTQKLLAALPAQYASIRDAIDASGTEDPESILQLLQEREFVMNKGELAMYSRTFRPSQPQASNTCLMCNEQGHQVADCLHKDLVQRTIRSAKTGRI